MTLRRYIIARALRRAIKRGARHALKHRPWVERGGIFGGEQVEWLRRWNRTPSDLIRPPSGRDDDQLRTEPRPPADAVIRGRQPIHFPRTAAMGLLGLSLEPEWTPLPRDARQAPWEAIHTFPKDARPKRDPYFGLMNSGAALSLICPACDLEQPPLTHGERTCPYCGLKLTLKGSHVFWWRDPLHVEAWKP